MTRRPAGPQSTRPEPTLQGSPPAHVPLSAVPVPVLAYVTLVVCGGAAVLTQSAYDLSTRQLGYEWLALAALTIVAGRFSIRLPKVPATLSVSEVFVFLILLAFGPSLAALTLTIDGLALSIGQRPRRLHRTLFNMAEPAVSIWLAGQVFYGLLGMSPAAREPLDASRLIGPVFAMAGVYFLSNTWLQALGVALETGASPVDLWKRHFSHVSLPCLAEASLAALIVHGTSHIALAAIGLAVPLFVVSYLTFKGSADRLRDAEKHVTEVNQLYLAAIEALAVAVDTKDQVTHGHLRRVQDFSVRLARNLGVVDELDIKAIEAASLLHDIGKLAVPDYLLNKPAALTPWEFERIKQHTVAGANILSCVEFPYPVVPLVLHHHENWDGSGYPTGLAGPAIPLGARILAVVDCYDALMSDRPYRRKLSERAAIDILVARRGSMYDPRVLDEFLGLLAERGAEDSGTVDQMPAPTRAPDPLRYLGPDEETDSGSLRPKPWRVPMLETIWPVVCEDVQRAIEGGFAVLYAATPRRDALVADLASDRAPEAVFDRVIPLGQGVSGWAGSTGEIVAIADAYLDLGPLADALGLRSCFAAPLLKAESLLGVLTVYSPTSLTPPQIALLKTLAAGLAAQAQATRAAPSLISSFPPKRGSHTQH